MSYWASHNRGDLGYRIHDGRQCSISVVMDAGAHTAFSGVRVVIVHKEHENFANLTLFQSYGSCQLSFCDPWSLWRGDSERTMSPLISHPTYGMKLRKANRQMHNFLDEVGSKNTKKETLTILFELVHDPLRDYYDLAHIDNPSTDGGLPPNLVKDFDKFWPLTSNQNSILFYLGSADHRFAKRNELDQMYAEDKVFPRRAFPYHEVRVIPINRSSGAFDSLPPSIIRKIVYHTIDYDLGWRGRLLACALVKKSWLPITELFFGKFGRETPDIENPVTFSNSLMHRSDCMSIVKEFDDNLFASGQIDHDWRSTIEDVHSSIRHVLRMGATSIRTLLLHKPTFKIAYDLLKDLQTVEHFELKLSDGHDVKRGDGKGNRRRVWERIPSRHCDPVYLSHIQELFREWKQLQLLHLSGWDKPEASPSGGHKKDITSSTPALVVLDLGFGVITGNQLGGFVSPVLSKVSLLSVQGLTNANLREFLLSIAASIMSFSLLNSQVSRLSGEEHAIETALPHMGKLSFLRVSGDGFTSKIIREKPGSSELVQPLVTTPPILKLYLFGDSSMGSGPIPAIELPSALGTTSWNQMIIWFSKRPNREIVKEAYKVARSRGINLEFN